MKKIMLAMMLVIGIGLSGNYSTCIDDSNVQQNFSIDVNGNMTNISVESSCPYGCDTDRGKCKTFDSGFGIIATLVIIFFTITMFWLSHFFKQKNDEETDVPKAGLGLIFMFLGLLGLFGVLIFAGTMVAGYDSSFLTTSSEWMLALSNIWGLVIGAFVMIIVIFFLMNIVRDRLVDNRR